MTVTAASLAAALPALDQIALEQLRTYCLTYAYDGFLNYRENTSNVWDIAKSSRQEVPHITREQRMAEMLDAIFASFERMATDAQCRMLYRCELWPREQLVGALTAGRLSRSDVWAAILPDNPELHQPNPEPEPLMPPKPAPRKRTSRRNTPTPQAQAS